jgi:hypothetical protein
LKITSTHEKAGDSERVFLEALGTKCSQGKGEQGFVSFVIKATQTLDELDIAPPFLPCRLTAAQISDIESLNCRFSFRG